MSKEKAAALLLMSDVEKAVWRSKRNQRSYWQRLPHHEWMEFCTIMSRWFGGDAVDELDNIVEANRVRDAASDAAHKPKR